MQKIVLLVVCLLGLLLGCGVIQQNRIQDVLQSQDLFQTCRSDQNCLILNKRYMQRFVAYNTATKGVVDEMSHDQRQHFVYEFNNPRVNCYTAGDSLSFGFSILCRDGATIKPVYTLDPKKREGIYPLAANDQHTFFILATYNASAGEVSRGIVEWDATRQQLTTLPNVQGLVSYGAIIKNQLYDTVYEQQTDSFLLYSIGIAKHSSKPQLLMIDLKAGEVYTHNDQLYISNREQIMQYGQEDFFPKQSLNYFDDPSQTVIQLYVDHSATLSLDVLDAQTKNRIASVTDVIDYSLAGNEIVVYRYGGIERILLRDQHGASQPK